MITIDQKIADYFLTEWNVNGWPLGNLFLCFIALVLCVVLVGLIGLEREKRGRSAGLRTHLLVGVSSAILMIISIYGFPAIFSGNRDVARLCAQIVTGVGFLGAGAIIHRNSGIKGLTTAGTIWASMAIGLACGSFNFILAIAGTLLIILVMTVFKRLEVNVSKKTPTIILTAGLNEPVMSKILEVSRKFNCTIHGVSTALGEEGNPQTMEVVFQAVFADETTGIPDYLTELQKETNAISVNLLSHI